ncbi:MAG: hypothetical protein WCL16_08085 [bacterium]
MQTPANNSNLRDNHTRGTVAEFLRAKIQDNSRLSVVSAYFTIYAYDAMKQALAKLGYKSDKFIVGAGSSPQAFLDLFNSGHAFDPAKALVLEWKTADLIFQLTDQELSRESSSSPCPSWCSSASRTASPSPSSIAELSNS